MCDTDNERLNSPSLRWHTKSSHHGRGTATEPGTGRYIERERGREGKRESVVATGAE